MTVQDHRDHRSVLCSHRSSGPYSKLQHEDNVLSHFNDYVWVEVPYVLNETHVYAFTHVDSYDGVQTAGGNVYRDLTAQVYRRLGLLCATSSGRDEPVRQMLQQHVAKRTGTRDSRPLSLSVPRVI